MRRLLLVCALCLPLLVVAAPRVEILALFRDAALLEIDGEQAMLRVGQEKQGVQLIAADSRTATLRIAGVEQTMAVTRRVGSRFEAAQEHTVSIPRNRQLQYVTNAEINGRRMMVLVDTGANVVALSSQHATTLNLDYRSTGQRSEVVTASGKVEAWRVRLVRVDVGGLVVENVDATVIEGSEPSTVLLGTSFLQHIRLSERDGILYLSRRL
jgi:aspartyl protease family protein